MRQDVLSVELVALCLMQSSSNGCLKMDMCFVLVVVGRRCVLRADGRAVVGVLRQLKRISPVLGGCIVQVMDVGHTFANTSCTM